MIGKLWLGSCDWEVVVEKVMAENEMIDFYLT